MRPIGAAGVGRAGLDRAGGGFEHGAPAGFFVERLGGHVIHGFSLAQRVARVRPCFRASRRETRRELGLVPVFGMQRRRFDPTGCNPPHDKRGANVPSVLQEET